MSSGLTSTTATLAGSSLTENFDGRVRLAADILLSPAFPPRIRPLQDAYRDGLIQQRSQPGFLASEMFARVMYGATRRPMSLTAGRARRRSRASARGVPPAALTCRSRRARDRGRLSMAEARNSSSRSSALEEGRDAASGRRDPPAMGPAKVSLSRGPTRSRRALGRDAGDSRTSPDYDVVTVMNAVIGGGPTGRLFTVFARRRAIRTARRAPVVATSSGARGRTDRRSDRGHRARAPDFLAEMGRLRDEPVPTKEFDDRRRGIIASFALSLESAPAVLNLHVTRYLYGLADGLLGHGARPGTMAVTQAPRSRPRPGSISTRRASQSSPSETPRQDCRPAEEVTARSRPTTRTAR